ncbi:MAG TPA: VOC family protein [Candidatus Kapabacteria bacterium]|nr:VOC family protein [Candidatus Kapabacteria bacterium]
MPKVTVKPGDFSWFELVTSDPAAAKKFYTSLFGWEAEDTPMGPDQFYTMLKYKGEFVGALYGMDKAQMERGVPPHWNYYVSVKSADESAAKAKSLGGTLAMEPFDVMDAGRMAVVKDPEGAMIQLWEAKQHKGAGIMDEPGAFCWCEVYVNNTDKVRAFYTGLFGWGTVISPEYTEWTNGERHIGGMMQIKPEWGPMPPSWAGYVMVENCDAMCAKAKSLGVTEIMGPQDIPNMGRFAMIKDPQGAMISIYQGSLSGS